MTPNRLRNTLEIKGRHFDTPSLRGAITAPLRMCWYIYIPRLPYDTHDILLSIMRQSRWSCLLPSCAIAGSPPFGNSMSWAKLELGTCKWSELVGSMMIYAYTLVVSWWSKGNYRFVAYCGLMASWPIFPTANGMSSGHGSHLVSSCNDARFTVVICDCLIIAYTWKDYN